MKIMKYIFDKDFIITIGLNPNSVYSVQDLRRILSKKKLIKVKSNYITLSKSFELGFKLKSILSYKEFNDFLRNFTIDEQMNNNNLSTLLKESDFNFVKVIEL